MVRAPVILLTAVLLAACGARQPARTTTPKSGWQHFTEPDALVFVGGSAVVATTTYTIADPDHDPLGFPSSEGGTGITGNQIPNWQVAVGTSLIPVLIGSSGTDARWEHSKGAAEALMTTAAITELTKNLFQRHRPGWLPGTDIDMSKSFFSGHSSLTASATTYAGLYLHKHVFSRWRGNSRFAWWEAPVYVALAALNVYVPYTRVEDNMHHTSDVVTGTLVGTAMSVAFFSWQESRYQRRARATEMTP